MIDALTDILQSIRMTGSVFSRAALAEPWGVESGTMNSGVFHAVVDGQAWVRLAEGSEAVRLDRGDIAFMPFGTNHLMMGTPDSKTRPIADLTTVDARGMGHLVVEGDGNHTSLICGSVHFDQVGAHPVFSMLPPLIVVRDRDGRLAGVVDTIIGLIAAEVDEGAPGSETVVARLTDALVVLMLRDFISRLEPGEGGWLGGLRDPGLALALGHIHRRPEHKWSVSELAAHAGMSRSAFFSKFRTLVGETPAEYLTRWRVHVGSHLLRNEDHSVAAAARKVGYASEAAFSNAFTRWTGVRPGAYRRSA